MQTKGHSLAVIVGLFTLIGLLTLAGTRPGQAQSQQGGLPELEKRVAALEAQANTAQAEVSD